MTVGERIKKYRKEKEWTQVQLAEKLCVKQQMIAQYENSKTPPKMETIYKIAAALEIPHWKLLDFKTQLDIPGVDSARYDFSDEETQQVIELLNDYEKLNDKGRNKVVELASDLTQVKKYRKDYEPELEQLQVKLPDSDTKE